VLSEDSIHVQTHRSTNTCHISRGVVARNISNSKIDLQGHSRSLQLVPLNTPFMIYY